VETARRQVAAVGHEHGFVAGADGVEQLPDEQAMVPVVLGGGQPLVVREPLAPIGAGQRSVKRLEDLGLVRLQKRMDLQVI